MEWNVSGNPSRFLRGPAVSSLDRFMAPHKHLKHSSFHSFFVENLNVFSRRRSSKSCRTPLISRVDAAFRRATRGNPGPPIPSSPARVTFTLIDLPPFRIFALSHRRGDRNHHRSVKEVSSVHTCRTPD